MNMRKIYGWILIFSLGIVSFMDTDGHFITSMVYAQEQGSAVTSRRAQPLEEIGKIYIKEHLIFLNEFGKGIHVINNRNPFKPEIVSFINIPGNVDIAIRDNVLYADSYTDLVVIDISHPTDISEIKRIKNIFPDIPLPSSFLEALDPEPVWSGGGCFTMGTMVLTAGGPRRIERVMPGTEVHSYDLSSGEWTFSKVSKQGAYRYQGDIITIQMNSDKIEATGNHPFFVLSGDKLASRPLPAEVLKEEQETAGPGRWVEARDLKTGDVLKSINGGELTVTGLLSRNEKVEVYHLEIESNHNYAVHQTGILVHNGGQKEKSAASSTGAGGSLARFTIASDYLYTLSGSAMQLFDIRNPADPSVWKKIEIGWDIETIFPYEDKLFIGGQTGMYIYDNSNPAEPELISRFAHITSCDPVVVEGNYAYVTLRGGTNCGGREDLLEIIDISDIGNPVLVASYPMDGPFGLGIDGGVLFICDGEGGLKLFDVSNVHKLKLIDAIEDIFPFDVILDDKRAVVVEKYGLNQYDYQIPENVELISRIPNVISKNENREPVLISAVRDGNTELVKILLEAGAGVNVVNWYGKSALMIAEIMGHAHIVDLLKGAGARE